MYTDQRVAKLIAENFIPARLHVRDDAEAFVRFGERYNAQWTPTILMLDPAGTERHRIEGFLPTDDFLAQLQLGVAQMSFKRGQFADAERQFRAVVDAHGDSDAAAEAMYWAGVSRYKGTGDASALGETARAFRERYQETPWAKKASVWGG